MGAIDLKQRTAELDELRARAAGALREANLGSHAARLVEMPALLSDPRAWVRVIDRDYAARAALRDRPGDAMAVAEAMAALRIGIEDLFKDALRLWGER